jgi:YHS domain-containing protein
MIKHIFIIGLVALVMSGCHSHTQEAPAPAASATAPIDTVKTLPAALIDNTKDPVCGMPASAGMEDSVHVGNKVIGFCSKECKSEYLKNPKAYSVVYK